MKRKTNFKPPLFMIFTPETLIPSLLLFSHFIKIEKYMPIVLLKIKLQKIYIYVGKFKQERLKN